MISVPLRYSLAFILLTLVGCADAGPERVEVQGQVTLNGKPLEHGRILFVPAGNHRGPLTGTVIENGEFRISSIEGPTIGSLRVEIRKEDPMTKRARENPGAILRNIKASPDEISIPRRYNVNSELRATTKRGEINVFNFKLESK